MKLQYSTSCLFPLRHPPQVDQADRALRRVEGAAAAAQRLRPAAVPHVPRGAPAARQALPHLRPLRGAVRPPLPLHLQLRRPQEPRLVPPLHPLRRRQLLHHHLLRLLLHQGR